MTPRRAYTQKQQSYERTRRRIQRARYRQQLGLPVEAIAAETELLANARAYRSAEQLEEMTLRRWLARYGHVLWSEPTTIRPAWVVPVPEELLAAVLPSGAEVDTERPTDEIVATLDPADYSWLSGSCG